MFAMMRIWLTNRPLFRALCALAQATEAIPGRVPAVDRQKINHIYWAKYDSEGAWQR